MAPRSRAITLTASKRPSQSLPQRLQCLRRFSFFTSAPSMSPPLLILHLSAFNVPATSQSLPQRLQCPHRFSFFTSAPSMSPPLLILHLSAFDFDRTCPPGSSVRSVLIALCPSPQSCMVQSWCAVILGLESQTYTYYPLHSGRCLSGRAVASYSVTIRCNLCGQQSCPLLLTIWWRSGVCRG
jgi:hypothetical protein